MSKMKLVSSVLAAIALAACAPQESADGQRTYKSIPAPTKDGVALHVTGADKGKEIAVRVGTTFQVDLIGVPTAGYAWMVAEAPAVLQAAGETGGATSEAQLEPGFAGGSHWEVFFFDVTGEGAGLLRFEQRRSWEDDEPPADEFSVTVRATAQ
ncbi:MAG: protease inhibitor I42 family protein [Parvularculaceae bacterium]